MSDSSYNSRNTCVLSTLTDQNHEEGVYLVGAVFWRVALYAEIRPEVPFAYLGQVVARESLENLQKRRTTCCEGDERSSPRVSALRETIFSPYRLPFPPLNVEVSVPSDFIRHMSHYRTAGGHTSIERRET